MSAAHYKDELLGEPYDDRAHEIAFFEILLWAHRMGIVAGHARVGDSQVCSNAFELVAVFKGNYPGSRVCCKFLESVLLRFGLGQVLLIDIDGGSSRSGRARSLFVRSLQLSGIGPVA